MSSSLPELGGWPGVLRPLLERRHLSAGHARAALAEVLGGNATPAQLGGFLVALRMKGETVEEITGLVQAMLDAATPVELPPTLDAVDTCGTGGGALRRRGACNVSTMAGLVVAGAGAPVCKHGNRAASSTCGSADLLEALGVAIDLGPEGVARCVVDVGFGFCFAPRFHPAMRHAGPTRRELGVPTVFNLLGPLANPAGVRRQLVGVSDPAVAGAVMGVLAARGAQRAMVVHGHDGLDELTTTTTSSVLELRDGEVRSWTLDPSELGIARADPSSIGGGEAEANVELFSRLLDGDRGPHRDLVLLNAAAALVVAGMADGLEAGYEAAAAALDGGAVAEVVERLVSVSQRSAAAAPA